MADASVTSNMSAIMDAALRQAFPATVAAIEAGLDNVLNPAVAAWPVKTGKSKAAFERYVRLTSETTVDGIIRNDARTDKGAPYTYYIAASWFRDASGRRIQVDNRWQQLVIKPTRTEARKIAKAAAQELVRVLVRSGSRG